MGYREAQPQQIHRPLSERIDRFIHDGCWVPVLAFGFPACVGLCYIVNFAPKIAENIKAVLFGN